MATKDQYTLQVIEINKINKKKRTACPDAAPPDERAVEFSE